MLHLKAPLALQILNCLQDDMWMDLAQLKNEMRLDGDEVSLILNKLIETGHVNRMTLTNENQYDHNWLLYDLNLDPEKFQIQVYRLRAGAVRTFTRAMIDTLNTNLELAVNKALFKED